MSSNADNGKPLDPYKAKNLDQEPGIKEKIEDLCTFIEKSKFGMMTTRDAESGKLVSRCMALAETDRESLKLLFHTNAESHKAAEIETNPQINISFLNSSGEWASLSGVSKVITDTEFVKKHYSSALKAWVGDLGDGVHTGGPEDPRIGIIEVTVRSITYALAKGTAVSRMVEVGKGMVTGNVADVNKLREIGEGEIETWRSSHKMVA
ncbi:hypothetical protein HYFRA_00011321 [Hymenoscyphus fraxineus]|uniref:General stress protein FMN-binding split barrel domain-containing protein n=1 Tax=Hymenoscyphus fraxineus TaxID=746836 RepID=A0A9N9L0G3_9HELO|nr:hypothetical protein HYFRA_00011321 [Hymenoscyphus fraxineus]